MDFLINNFYLIIIISVIIILFISYLLGSLLVKLIKKMVKYFTPIKTRFIGEILDLTTYEIPIEYQSTLGYQAVDSNFNLSIFYTNRSYVKLKTKKRGVVNIKIPLHLYLKLKNKGKEKFSFYCHKYHWQNNWEENTLFSFL